jgi:uncharacterized iron-regulated protein
MRLAIKTLFPNVSRATSTLLVMVLAACASAPAVSPIEQRLSGDTIALLGEVHDNEQGHNSRLLLLARAIDAGWRPAIVMEQFDIGRQADIDRARRQAPEDAQHVIDLAAPVNSGWDWTDYKPVISLALHFQLPLLAGNLPNADTNRIVKGGYAAVFDEQRIAELGLAKPIDPIWQAAQNSEIDSGHCGMLPAAMWPVMARAQFARDAVMAEVLRANASHGAVLIAGNGHARRDIGVARWFTPEEQARTVAIGYLETEASSSTAPVAAPAALEKAFDAIVALPPAARADPCEAFAKHQGMR